MFPLFPLGEGLPLFQHPSRRTCMFDIFSIFPQMVTIVCNPSVKKTYDRLIFHAFPTYPLFPLFPSSFLGQFMFGIISTFCLGVKVYNFVHAFLSENICSTHVSTFSTFSLCTKKDSFRQSKRKICQENIRTLKPKNIFSCSPAKDNLETRGRFENQNKKRSTSAPAG